MPVDGVEIIGPHDTAWSSLSSGDCTPRTRWPTQVILHKTLADDPEKVLDGHGSPGHAKRTADAWREDPKHSGAHIVIGDDVTACLADLVTVEAWDANQANLRSIGIEHCEEFGGIVRRITLQNGVKVCLAIAERCGIQLQVPRLGSYHEGKPLARYADGGTSLVGFFGHRDVVDSRGRWDPGDVIFSMLVAAGAEQFDFSAGDDLVAWKQRQTELVAKGYQLTIDGVPGPKTTAALRSEGYRGGVWALGKV